MSRADQSHRRRKNPLAAVFRAVGIILLIAIIAICVPLIVPKTMGYQLYTVVSGSMEPAVPTGSLVYIKYVEPGDIETGYYRFLRLGCPGIHHHTSRGI